MAPFKTTQFMKESFQKQKVFQTNYDVGEIKYDNYDSGDVIVK